MRAVLVIAAGLAASYRQVVGLGAYGHAYSRPDDFTAAQYVTACSVRSKLRYIPKYNK